MKAKEASRSAHPTRRGSSSSISNPAPIGNALALVDRARVAFAEIIEAEQATFGESIIVEQFGATLVVGQKYHPRKDVTFMVQSIDVLADCVSVWVEVNCRGRLYVGELTHRVPVIPTTRRFGGSSSWSWQTDLRTYEGRPCPIAAGELVREHVETAYREVFDESDPEVVEILLTEVIEAHAMRGGLHDFRLAVSDLEAVLRRFEGE